MNKLELYKRAIEQNGINGQLGVAQEELSELIQAISKHKRYGDNLDNLAEEMADVEIMLDQMKLMFDNELEIEVWKEYKLIRLGIRMDKNAENM